jgi:hypothetical protein
MGRIKSYDCFKQDSLLLEFMKKHKGNENVVSSKAICIFLNEHGYVVKTESVHTIIRRVMYEWNAPICHINSKGYYWAASREEILHTITDIELRILALQTHIEHLKNFIIE